MSRPNVHVSKRTDGYAVKSEGTSRAYRTGLTQQQAAEIGRSIAQNRGSELLIHNRHNRIRERNSYGNDPYPPRG
ncbi:DUF2188 domain-containing protein [Corynebacterium phoceense]|uniref:DUF2188 domain-containing protein n=1 Tax=Corynebacterium phoceense TaxID=1686286 RepID=UPI00211CA05E|nr:DUF2188 domain-containing protein [Corynebacterium phoceense]MCQ9337082.1 DUF2188 domain-containing protein [Corynebacterium phoceense]